MAPLTKYLHSGASGSRSKSRRIEEEDEAFANAAVETVEPDREDVLEQVYIKVTKIRKDEDLEPEHKLSATKNIIKKAAEKLKMNMAEFRLLLDDHIGKKPDWVEMTKTITKAVDNRVVVAEKRVVWKKVSLNNGQRKNANTNLVGFKLNEIVECVTHKLSRTNGEGSFYIFNLRKWTMDKAGEKTDKSFCFTIYENLTALLIESIMLLLTTAKTTSDKALPLEKMKRVPIENAEENGPSFLYDMSNIGKLTYDNGVSYDLSEEIEVFVRFIFNRWHLTIRKHRSVKSGNPKDKPFDFDLPVEEADALVRLLRLYRKTRGLSNEPLLSSPRLSHYKDHPMVKALLEWEVPENDPPKPDAATKKSQKRKVPEYEDVTDDEASSTSATTGSPLDAKRARTDDRDDMTATTDDEGEEDKENRNPNRPKSRRENYRRHILDESNSDSSDAGTTSAKKKKKQ